MTRDEFRRAHGIGVSEPSVKERTLWLLSMARVYVASASVRRIIIQALAPPVINPTDCTGKSPLFWHVIYPECTQCSCPPLKLWIFHIAKSDSWKTPPCGRLLTHNTGGKKKLWLIPAGKLLHSSRKSSFLWENSLYKRLCSIAM